MKVIYDQSIYQTVQQHGPEIFLTKKEFRDYPEGTNKAAEYSWFYLIALQGFAGEKITINVNIPDRSWHPTRKNGLVFFSTDRWHWQPLAKPVATSAEGLAQRFDFILPTDQIVYVSNTILYEYRSVVHYLTDFCQKNRLLFTTEIIGKSQDGHNLTIYHLKPTGKSQGRILLTTGCHPAEPDIITSFTVLNYLVSKRAHSLREKFQIDIMPIQNPDGFVNGSCLTSNGINLYWNFRKDDQTNCPEAFYLWQYIKKNPPLLYLDFHAYVHQHHRHPLPYLKPLTEYTGRLPKYIVNQMDHRLTRLSNNNYHYGKLSAWPYALSYYVTKYFNTIAYTKYHVNLNEGVLKSQHRALQIFIALTTYLVANNINANDVLTTPDGNVNPDLTDTALWRKYYALSSLRKKIIAHSRAYYRYYRYQ